MKRILYISAIFTLILSFSVSGTLAKKFEDMGPPTIIVLDSTDKSVTENTQNYIESQGGHVVHVYPPHVMIGYVSDQLEKSLLSNGKINKITRDLLDPATVERYGLSAVAGAVAWNNNFKGMAKFNDLEPPLNAPDGSPLDKDTFARPAPKLGAMMAPPYGASSSDTSEYMLGKIAVGIILTESNGSVDKSTEDWDPTEENAVVSEIQAGLNWWANIANKTIGATLTYVYDVHLRVPTKYEPINHPQSDQGLWITDAMSFLGYNSSSGYFSMVDQYCNTMRDTYNTDWAYTIFVADSSVDADGIFSDGKYFAYAYIGGPFLQMTYDNDGWGISRMDQVTAHETGHIYYALDEYASSNCSKTATSGYLKVPNTNCSSGINCIMNNNSFTVDPCQYTMGQIGLRDTDGDKIADILDVPPDSILNPYSPDPSSDDTPTYTGSAKVVPLVNMNPYGLNNDITISKIANVQYRVDGGAWANAIPTDGAYNGASEAFTFTTSTLSSGTHTIEVRAIDSSGNIETSYSSDQLTINGAPAQPPILSNFAINNGVASTGSQTVTLNHTASNSPTEYMASENLDFAGASWLAYVSAPSFTLSPGYGTKTVYMKLRNAVGESNIQSDTIEYAQILVLDSLSIDGGATTTIDQLVELKHSISGGIPTQYMASESATFVGAIWQTYVTVPNFTLSNGYGTKTVYMKLRNAGGESSVKSDTIQYIETKPSLTYFKINDGAAAKIISRIVTLNNTTDVKPTHYMASESSTFSKARWIAYSTAPSFTLSKNYGIKTVYFKVKNGAGESDFKFDNIEYAKSLTSIEPEGNLLLQNYPNPFNPDTWIPYQLGKDVKVVVSIYTGDGHLIRTLNRGFQKAGYYIEKDKAAYWDGKTETGEVVSSGVYFYTIKAGDFTITKKMLITK